MKINSYIKLYGLLGCPIRHSLSPIMHNAAFKALKINAEYKLFEVKSENIESFLWGLSERNIYGLNVTIPYKEKVIAFLNKISHGAKLIGAVNTIKVNQNSLEGFNTDGEGFLRHIRRDLGFNPRRKIIAIIGAGGASRAVSVYLSKEKPKRISIYDTDRTKVENLVKHLKECFGSVEFKQANSIEGLDIKTSDLLINATPIGMKETDPCLVKEDFIHKNLLVYDLIYNPKETKLLRVAKEKGARVSSGLGMLLYQGMLSFEIWTAKIAPKKAMQEALLEGLN